MPGRNALARLGSGGRKAAACNIFYSGSIFFFVIFSGLLRTAM
jgi:hypothetical protein